MKIYLGSQKGIINIGVIVLFAFVVAVGGYFVLKMPIGRPIFLQNPTPTPITAPNYKNIVSSCEGISNALTAELDGKPIEPLRLATPSGTLNGHSFELLAGGNTTDNRIERDVHVVASELAVGKRELSQVRLFIEYKEYDRTNTPYVEKISFVPETMTGQIDTQAVSENSGEHVCGSFDATGTGNYGGKAHKIHAAGSFNLEMPFPQPGLPISPTPNHTPLIKEGLEIKSLNPASGSIGTKITINGLGFTPGGNTARFNLGIISNLNSSDGKTLSFVVPNPFCPPGTGTPCPLPSVAATLYPKASSVFVENANGKSNTITFLVTDDGSNSANSSPPDNSSYFYEDSNGRTIEVVTGQTIQIILSSTYWHFDGSSDASIVALQSEPIVQAAPIGACVPGAGCGTVRARFNPLKSGTARISASRTVCGEALACQPDQKTFILNIIVK